MSTDDTKSDHLTHIDADGNARMVDVSDKDVTRRTATAGCRVIMQAETVAQHRNRQLNYTVKRTSVQAEAVTKH